MCIAGKGPVENENLSLVSSEIRKAVNWLLSTVHVVMMTIDLDEDAGREGKKAIETPRKEFCRIQRHKRDCQT